MNTGLLRHAVATVLTVYGIETILAINNASDGINALQQYLPFTVLKPSIAKDLKASLMCCNSTYRLRY